MKQGFLFFCIAGFIFLSESNYLLGNDTDKTTVSTTVYDEQITTTILADTICDLLLHGYSIDEITATLNDNQDYPHDIQKIAMLIQTLLNKQYSKEKIVSFIVSNEGGEESYVKNNFGTKVKNVYRILKVIIVFVIITVVLYLLYNYYQYLKHLLDWLLGFLPGMRPSPTNNQPTQGIGTQLPQNVQQAVQNTPQLPHETPAAEALGASGSNRLRSLGPFAFNAYCSPLLEVEIVQDIEHARNIGLEPAVLPLSAFDPLPNTLPRNTATLCERIQQQIAYARSIGLEPAAIQQ